MWTGALEGPAGRSRTGLVLSVRRGARGWVFERKQPTGRVHRVFSMASRLCERRASADTDEGPAVDLVVHLGPRRWTGHNNILSLLR